MKKSKLFAPFLMLLAGTVASITMRCFHYSTGQMLPRLLIVLVAFYVAGCFIQKKVYKFVDEILTEEAKEGEVIEKEVPEGEKAETAKEPERKGSISAEDSLGNGISEEGNPEES